MMQRYWQAITRSEFSWEQEALDYVREHLPESDLYRAWANFEITTHAGKIYEIDLLVISPAGVFLVEAKSWKGRVEGDATSWTLRSSEHRTRTLRNPRLGTNHKAKVLKSLVLAQKNAPRVFIEPLVFLSDPDVQLALDERGRQGVVLRDREATAERPGRRGILHRLKHVEGRRLDRPTIEKFAAALESAGVRRWKRHDRIGRFQLVESLGETETYQEWLVRRVDLPDLERRLRLYPVGRTTDAAERERMVRAARREFQLLDDLKHPGIDRPLHADEDDRGPYLLFDPPGGERRLDRFVADEGERLGLGERVALLRRLFETLDFAHDRGLIHRALSPRCVSVLRDGEHRDGERYDVRVGDWSAGRRDAETRQVTGTEHVDALIDPSHRLYLAPELLAGRPVQDFDEPALDVFSLGALAYLVLTGSPPAGDELEMRQKLEEGPGLRLASVVDGAISSLHDLVVEATRPDVGQRSSSVGDLLAALDLAEDQMQTPSDAPPVVIDPMRLKVGDTLPCHRSDGDLVIRHVLGSGATARVFEVADASASRQDPSRGVLKLARHPELNGRLREELDVLQKLRHEHIVAVEELVEVGDHLGILMESAGDETVARALARDPFDTDELRRLGEELLRVVDHLEEHGIAHRDLKPANIGLATTPRGRRQLKVFDFSLSRASTDRLRAGTLPYLDPFLGRATAGGRVRDRWDVQAERYAAAVTLYEMASRRRLVWGDGRSDPGLLADPAPEIGEADFAHLDEPIGRALNAFFRRAVAPDIADRFDTCEEMLFAWREAFTGTSAEVRDEAEAADEAAPAPAATRGRGPDPAAPPFDRAALDRAALDDPLDALGLPGRPRNALRRAGAETLADLLRLDLATVYEQPSVGSKTRRQLHEIVAAVRARFPGGPEPIAAPSKRESDPAIASVDAIFERLVPTRGRGRPLDRDLLGTNDALGAWPSQTELAAAHEISRQAAHQAVARARKRWHRDLRLRSLRDEIAALLARRGHVMLLDEVVEAVLYLRGSIASESERPRRARAVTRALVEAEAAEVESRFAAFRREDRVFLAATRVDDLGRDLGADVESTDLGASLVAWAQRLGVAADRLAEHDPLPGAARVEEHLAALPAPLPVDASPPERLASLAAAASRGAALSSRRELYPRGLDPARAVHLGRGALLGVAELRVEEIRERIRSRFPEAAPLPDPPELSELLDAADTGLAWDATKQRYLQATRQPLLSTSVTETADGGPAQALDVARFVRRLERARERGDFLFLTASPKIVEHLPARLAARFGVRPTSVERGLIEAMRTVFAEHGLDFSLAIEADARRGSEDWQRLVDFVRRDALPRFEQKLEVDGSTLLLTHPGLVGRYDALAFFERLRRRCGAALGAWVLVPSGDPTASPKLDGHPLAILAKSEHVPVPPAFVEEPGANPVP